MKSRLCQDFIECGPSAWAQVEGFAAPKKGNSYTIQWIKTIYHNPGPDPWPRPGMSRWGNGKSGIHKHCKQLHIHTPSRSPRRRLYEPEARANWLARTEFNSVCFRSITVTTPLCRVSMQVAQWRNWMRSYGRYRHNRGFKIRDQQDEKNIM